MMQGVVSASYEAMLRLVIGNGSTQRQVIDAVIDTGFTGFLSLPSAEIRSINNQTSAKPHLPNK